MSRLSGSVTLPRLPGTTVRAAVRGSRGNWLRWRVPSTATSPAFTIPARSTQAKDLTEKLGEARPDAWPGTERSLRDREAGSPRSPETQHPHGNDARSAGWSAHQRNTRTRATRPSWMAHTPRHPDHSARYAATNADTSSSPHDIQHEPRQVIRRKPLRQRRRPSTTTDRDHPPRSCKP